MDVSDDFSIVARLQRCREPQRKGGANFENLPTRIGEGDHVFRFEDPRLRICNVNILTSIYV